MDKDQCEFKKADLSECGFFFILAKIKVKSYLQNWYFILCYSLGLDRLLLVSPRSFLTAVRNGAVQTRYIVPLPDGLLNLNTVLVVFVVGLLCVPVGVVPRVSINPGKICRVISIIAAYPEVLSGQQIEHK